MRRRHATQADVSQATSAPGADAPAGRHAGASARPVRLVALCAAAAIVVAIAGSGASAQSVAAVRRLDIDGPITAVTYDYIDRALTAAESDGAAAALIQIDTPGGDSTSTLNIIQRILNAQMPVLAWVGPAGAQAASAGTFLVLAAHASGMAPNTMIGAASPVGAGGAELPATSARKLTEDFAATARSLAARRGDKAQAWAESAVREAASASAAEALDIGLIDAVAATPQAFLDSVDGLTVTVGGQPAVLHTAGAPIEDAPMNAAEQLLAFLVHPAIALLLLTLGVNAILIELSSPGGFVAGTIGVLALVLAFYSLGAMQANWVGLVFIAVSFALFVLDIKAPTHGLLTAAGIAVFVIGAVVLFRGGWYEVPWSTIAALAVGMGLFFAFVVASVVRIMRRPPVTGTEGLVGGVAVVRQALSPEGMVFVEGELWRARLSGGGSAPPGAHVTVLAREGATLVVKSEP